ncbi:MAG: secretin and TonB N-terminal domain-containing protein [Bacteroidetes bacterium]|nr:secretin and TonB N-terminal domain-containing protein [Bacteroidota bacterium]
MKIKFLIIATLLVYSFNALAQKERLLVIQQRLKDLSLTVPGLNQTAELSISSGSLQEFLRGLASTHNLNINVDPSLNQRVTNYFANEKVSNILLYLIEQYNLDVQFVGSIMTFTPYKDPAGNLPKKPKEILVDYNSPNETISFDLNNDTLIDVAKKITRLTNKNVVVLPDAFYKTVTGYVQNLPIYNALEKLSLGNNFKLSKTNDNVYVIGTLAPDEELVLKPPVQNNPSTTIKKVNKNNPGQSSSAEVFDGTNGKKLINLNTVNSPILDVIKNISAQAGINYFIYSDIKGNVTATASNMEFDNALSFILQNTDYTYRVDNNVYMIGEREKEGLRANKIIQLRYRSVDSILAFIPQEIKKGVDIKEFKELNSFLVTGSSPQINEIESFVKNIDRLVPMIMIEVILLDVKKSKTVKTGITAGISDSVKTGGTILGGNGLDFTAGANSINSFIDRIGINNVFNIGHVAPNFYVNLQALENNSNIELRQTPKLSTLNGHKASLSIGSTRYYAVTTQNVLGSLNPQTVVTQQFIPVEANLAIDIKPIVSSDDQVTLNIDVNISDFIGTTALNVPPPTSKSMFSSIIRVHSEEMIVLGGIERNEKSEDGSGVPFLSRVPVLKWLFSSRSKTNSKVVSVVFIKPTIIY